MGLSLVEETYFQAWGRAGGPGRVRRAFSLSTNIWKIVEHTVRQQNPTISDGEAAWLAAKRMYSSSAAAQRLLDRMEGQYMPVEPDFQETTERVVRNFERARSEVSLDRGRCRCLLRRPAVDAGH